MLRKPFSEIVALTERLCISENKFATEVSKYSLTKEVVKKFKFHI